MKGPFSGSLLCRCAPKPSGTALPTKKSLLESCVICDQRPRLYYKERIRRYAFLSMMYQDWQRVTRPRNAVASTALWRSSACSATKME